MSATSTLSETTLLVSVNFHGLVVERQTSGLHALYGKYGYGRYTSNIGYLRILNLLERLNIKATWFVPSEEAQDNPACIKAIASDGHEVAANGIDLSGPRLGIKDESADLVHAHTVLADLTGIEPVGWRAPTGALSPDTLQILQSLGYLYDSSFQDHYQPYSLVNDGASGMVELPQNEILIDATLWNARATHDRVLRTWTEEFNAASSEKCLIHLTLHPRADSGSGRASRIDVVEKFLRHVLASGVECKTARSIAAHFLQAR
ncbi:polysaccharide deacetylase family protein [Burkholderia multivorans]|uniref:polysaccharide deacetylase family protein n=1 Tax=Burkholderia multivorans TaxID=87883 RepID=UPI001C21A645|nr:polysaccharide deacetylase family protein [Burkholderia multivorans]MBU9185751.1 polysaccharide deacetylase family protein [Burkholderia multivorans]MBU9284116.1 polysaccharide deacetylase family protein [Burkholderia multivorans]MBU9420749.1 polysaccharide deacetylase family protein [Burkholderia multivorans]MDN7451285.1 polysaccharide deacetylase family protein [Burkholderia multivorans]